MLGLTQLEQRLIILAAVLSILMLLLISFGWHERSLGMQKCELADVQVAAIQKAAQAAQEAADAQRLKDAQHAYQSEIARLSQPQPATHVVCHSAGPERVSKAAGVSETQPSGAGPFPPERPRDFDPGPALDTLHDEADQIVAACRKLDAAVHH